jgi:long-chain fatty acid transport protein
MVSFRDIKFSGPTGSAELDDPAYTAHFYVSTDLAQHDKWRIGFGVNMPFGSDMNWGSGTPFANVVTESSMLVLSYQPTVAYQVTEQLFVGGGLNIYQGSTLLKSQPYAPWLTLAELRFRGSGVGVGTTLGVLYKLNDQHSFGATYRCPFTIEYEGHAEVSNAAGYERAEAETTIQYPQSVALGYAFRPISKLKLELDVEWTDWDVLNDANLETGNALNGMAVAFRYKSSFFYELGAQYNLTDNWAIRAGYIYSENSIPSEWYSASLPDGNRHVLSVGAGYSAERFSVDLVYQYSLTEERTVDSSVNTTVNGTWESQSHAVMLTGSLKF